MGLKEISSAWLVVDENDWCLEVLAIGVESEGILPQPPREAV